MKHSEQLAVSSEQLAGSRGRALKAKSDGKTLRLQTKTLFTTHFSLLTFLALFTVSCDLFNTPVDPNYLKNIDIEIAWANAAKLDVAFHAPEGWINSSSPSLSRTAILRNVLDIRSGFEFSLECEPSAAVGFDDWLVFDTEFYNNQISISAEDREKNAAEIEAEYPEHCLIGNGVTLVEKSETGGNRKATFVINTDTPVTIVPWCGTRPKIVLSTPPLINTGGLFSLGQTISLRFSEPGLDYENGVLENFYSEGLIQISGQSIPAQANDPVNFYPDLSGYFNPPVYDDDLQTITISPLDLPIEELSIILTAGPNIVGKNGSTMSAPVNISWRTSTDTVRDKYTAKNIWAVHDPVAATSEEDFFYQGALSRPTNNYRDARLRKNGGGDYEITLYFSITANNEEMKDPTHCFVKELRAYNIMGNNATLELSNPETYEIIPITVAGIDSTADIYRERNSHVRTYRITHTLPQDIDNGIWRLILIPYRDEGEGVRTGVNSWENARDEGSYATVVINNNVPTRNPQFTLRGAQESSTGVFNYGVSDPALSFDLNFNNVEDNWHNSGITEEQASDGKPWTIDSFNSENFNKIEWQWQIVGSNGVAVYNPNPAEWLSTGVVNISNIDVKTAIGSSQDIRRIQMRYHDSLGQENANWLETGMRLTYFEANYGEITAWSAEYDPDENEIRVSWTNPPLTHPDSTPTDFDRVEVWYRVNGMSDIRPDKFNPSISGYDKKGSAFTISNVPRLNTTVVQNGSPVSNISTYEIFLRVCSVLDSKPEVSFKIWNFGTADSTSPGISVNQSNTVEVNSQAAFLSAIGDPSIPNIVLTGDIELVNWTPPAAAFTRKLYGGGKTIILNNVSSFNGIFDTVSAGAEIRDLTVYYPSNVSASATATRIGGFAGTITGGAKIRNLIVSGSNNAALMYNGSGTPYFGGITGELTGTETLLENVYNAFNMSLSSTASGSNPDLESNGIRIGGIAGYVENSSISGSVWAAGAYLTVTQCFERLYAGGVTGKFYSTTGTSTVMPTISNAISMGNITVNSDHHLHLGGIAGQASNIDSAAFSKIADSRYDRGAIYVRSAARESTVNNIGGFAGTIGFSTDRITGFTGTIILPDLITNTGTSFTGNISNAQSITISYIGRSSLFIGGFAGSVSNAVIGDTNNKNESYSPIYLPQASQVSYFCAGGFAGIMRGTSHSATSIINGRSFGSLDITTGRNTSLTETYTGGFVGNIYGDNSENGRIEIKQSSATGSINTTVGVRAHSGGFAGYARHAGIQNSKATGNVKIDTTPGRIEGDLYGGGFIGHAHTAAVISDSYALGDLHIDDSTPTLGNNFAGGFIGLLGAYTSSDPASELTRCFATGMVINQRVSGRDSLPSGSGTATDTATGGLIGYVYSGSPTGSTPVTKINGCVAINAFLFSFANHYSPHIARIYGYPATGTTTNYGEFNVAAWLWDDYNGGVRQIKNLKNSLGTDHNGVDETMMYLRTSNWWTLTLPADLRYTAANGWSMDGIGRGYPMLLWELD